MDARTIAGAMAIALVLALAPPEPTLLTAPQRDALSSPLDPPSASVSADGRFVAFASYARLAPADTNGSRDIYVLDRTSRRVTVEIPPADGRAPTGDGGFPGISGDGRYVVFELTREADGRRPFPHTEVILRDRWTGTTRIVSAGATGEAPDGWSRNPAISADGRIVVFGSVATNVAAGSDANGAGEDVHVFDVATGSVRRVSLDNASGQAPVGASFTPSVSADGRYVAFTSTAPLDGDRAARRLPQVYVRDRQLNVTMRASAAAASGLPNGASSHPAISGDGRYVAFVSDATNLVPGDRNRAADVFLYDTHLGTTTLVSRSANGGAANGASGNPAIARDGRFVAFQSEASDLICARRCPAPSEDINLVWDVFVLDRQTGQMTCVSTDPAEGWMESSRGPAIDAAGRVLAFSSLHPIDARDTGHDFDLFVRLARAP
jgi:Tol biopolymer transport system component